MMINNQTVVNKLCKIAIGMFVPMVILTGCKNPVSVIFNDEPEIGVVEDGAEANADDTEQYADESELYVDESELYVDESELYVDESELYADDAELYADDSELYLDETNSADDESDSKEGAHSTIVWLGDSLTQGSLGDDNDNFANAPYLKLADLSGRNVEGYGFYGYNTHDIFWVYSDENHENQRKDPNKTYIFWVGSNDWVVNGVANDNATPVMAEIDQFITSGGIKNFLVLGTTARYELRSNPADSGESAAADAGTSAEQNKYELINDQLRQHYGKRYLDVNPAIPVDGGYGPDNVHLTQQSYDDVAVLVNRKLKELGI